jgi:hypothetical protein
MVNMFKRWTVFDGISGRTLPERFFWRKDAEDMKRAIESLYVFDGIRSGDFFDEKNFDLIEVVKVQ